MGFKIKGRFASKMNITEILPNLYIGAAPPVGEDLKDEGFKILWLCAEEYQPEDSEFDDIEVHRIKLEDHGQPISDSQISDVKEHAALLARQIRSKGRPKILVSCRMGLVRSATLIIAALKILHSSKSLDDLISMLRSVRDPRVLASANWVGALYRMFPGDKSDEDVK